MAGLKEHGSATVDELREFLTDFRGKSAKEMLGSLAESGLVRAMSQATIVSVVVIGAFTVVPYLLEAKTESARGGRNAPAAVNTASSNAAAAKPADAPAGAPTAAPTSGAANSPATVPGTSPDLEQAAKVLGVSETKSADPKNNPREKDLDSLLDKIK